MEESYSEFHFGAGESSVIRMVAEIELASDYALVLIEEIENGLHPVATIRMVEYLIEAANRKKIQAIFTTHSNDALKPLPAKAIWVAIRDKIFQGKLDVGLLRAITGQVERQLVIFVEDQFAKTWLEAMLRQVSDKVLDQIEVHALGGDTIAVDQCKYHNANPSIRVKAMCYIDGNSRLSAEPENSIFKLPGDMPEAVVFDESWISGITLEENSLWPSCRNSKMNPASSKRAKTFV